jgi:putative sterol carrier protein
MAAFTTSKEIFDTMCSQFQPAKAQGENALIQFDLSGDKGGKYWVKVADGTCQVGDGGAPAQVDITLRAVGEDYVKMINGELNPMSAFMMGKIKVEGNMGIAMKLMSWFAMG